MISSQLPRTIPDLYVQLLRCEIMAKSKVHPRKATARLIFSRTMALKRSAKTRCLLGVFRTVSSVPSALTTPRRLKSRLRVLQCNHCRHQMSLTEPKRFCVNTKTPLTRSLMMQLLSQTKTGFVSDGAKVPVDVNMTPPGCSSTSCCKP